MRTVQPTTSTPITSDERARALAIAAKARCDARTAVRALREGPAVIRTTTVREAVERAMRDLGEATPEGGRAA
jgi:hypothetical protein